MACSIKEDQASDNVKTAKRIKSFKELSLDDRLNKAIAKVQWSKPTLVQAAAIPHVIEGADVVCKSKTGSGKTGAYALCALQLLLKKTIPNPCSVIILVPTKTLASQTTKVFCSLMKWTSQISVANISTSSNEESMKAQLFQDPHILVGTPASILMAVKSTSLSLNNLSLLVVDEADLQFSYGYSGDLSELRQHFPAVKQTILMSATMTDDVESLCLHLNNPVKLDLNIALNEESKLEQYVVKCTTDDKFLLLYTLLKLNLIRGKTILFVFDTNRCYQVKLFLEQFSINSCVLNFELPSNCVAHAIDQFNRGIYDTIITSDDHQNKDYNISRGIDFQCVDNIINLDFPSSPEQYVHRVGRTARAFNTGCSLTYLTPQNETKFEELKKHLKKSADQADEFKPYNFNMSSIEGFRYRCVDAFRSVTKFAVQECRRKEIKQEIINSEKLKTFFTENPKDLEVLRHDKVGKTRDVKEHLSTVPDYLVPSALKGTIKQGKKKKSKIDFSKKKVGNYKGQASKRKADPLKSFKYKKQKAAE